MYLFVAGCPRSGTTVLTRLLNLHPEIVIGLERYKRVVGRIRGVTAQMFEPDTFFNFQPDETSFSPASSNEAAHFYDSAKAKFPRAKFIGDKYPQFFRFYGGIFQNLPDARIIFIVRDPRYVAQSWQRRSEDRTEWPAKNDARRAVEYWNDSLAYTLAYTQIKKNAFVFVDYEEFFAAKEASLFELFEWIGADTPAMLKAQIAEAAVPEFRRSEEVLARDIELDSAVIKEIDILADRNLYRRARKIIQAQRSRPRDG